MKAEQPQVVEALRSELGLASSLPPQRMPVLVEHNPVIAVEVRWHVRRALRRFVRVSIKSCPVMPC